MTDRTPLLLIRAVDAERAAIYAERAVAFAGNLTGPRYVLKMTALDGYTFARCRKTVYALVAEDEVHSNFRASVECYLYDIYVRIGDSTSIQKGACINSLWVPPRHRGNGCTSAAFLLLTHADARMLMRKVVAALRIRSDVSIIVGSVGVGMESIWSRQVQWHDQSSTSWSVSAPPDWHALGQLPNTTPLYDYELGDICQLGCQRARQAVEQSSSPAFAFIPTDSRMRYYLAFFRMNFKYSMPDSHWPYIVGARVGNVAEPEECSFVIAALLTREKSAR